MRIKPHTEAPVLLFICAALLLTCRSQDAAPRQPVQAGQAPRAVVVTPAPSQPVVATQPTALELPWVSLEEASDCAVKVSVPLVALEPDVSAVALVLSRGEIAEANTEAPRGGFLVPLSCQEGRVAREVPRALFDAAQQARLAGKLALELYLRPPQVTCDKGVAIRACGRTLSGALVPGKNAGGELEPDALVIVPQPGARLHTDVATPSGPFAIWSLNQPGAAVLGYDPLTERVITTHVQRMVEYRRPRHAVALELADGRRLVVGSSVAFFVPAQGQGQGQGEYRQAGSLVKGDALLAEDGRRVELSAVSSVDGQQPTMDLFVNLDVSYPDNYFIGGLLVRDAGSRPSARTPTVPLPQADADPDVTLRPAPQSYDCQLELRLELRRWPAGADDIAFLAAPVPNARALGERRPVPYSAKHVVLALPQAVFLAGQAGRAALGADTPLIFAATLGGEGESSPIECDAQYDVLALPRRAGVSLQPQGLARSGLAGSYCFVAGTPISTPQGPVPIEALREGILINSYDVARQRVVQTRVRRVHARDAERLIRLTLSTGAALDTTPEHPFFLPALGEFRTAALLQPGDWLLTDTGAAATVVSTEERSEHATVYNLSVGEPHTYFAGSVLVHNY